MTTDDTPEVRGGYTLDGYYGDPELRAKHAAMQTTDDTRPLSAAEESALRESVAWLEARGKTDWGARLDVLHLLATIDALRVALASEEK